MSGEHPGAIFDGALGAIFDLNGVLGEDEPLHEAAFIAALAPYGIALTHETYQATILGRTDVDGVLRVAAASGRSLPVDEIVQTKSRLYRERLRSEGARYSAVGARQLVAALGARGLRLAIASASPEVEVSEWIEILGLDGRFDPVMTRESLPVAKPHPAVFEAIRDRWGVPSSTCVVLDDHPENIAIAHALSMRTVGVASTLPRDAFDQAQVVVRGIGELCA